MHFKSTDVYMFSFHHERAVFQQQRQQGLDSFSSFTQERRNTSRDNDSNQNNSSSSNRNNNNKSHHERSLRYGVKIHPPKFARIKQPTNRLGSIPLDEKPSDRNPPKLWSSRELEYNHLGRLWFGPGKLYSDDETETTNTDNPEPQSTTALPKKVTPPSVSTTTTATTTTTPMSQLPTGLPNLSTLPISARISTAWPIGSTLPPPQSQFLPPILSRSTFGAPQLSEDTSSTAPSRTGTDITNTSSLTSTITTTTSKSSASSSKSSSDPRQPKMALATWYGQRPRNHQISKAQYVCWDNGGQNHVKRFTCILVCPLTGEIFPAGKFGDPSKYEVQVRDEPADGTEEGEEQETVWYPRKGLAEHGAAARAYDCRLYREFFGSHVKPTYTGQSAPYLAVDDPRVGGTRPPPIPPIPSELQAKVDQLVQDAICKLTNG